MRTRRSNSGEPQYVRVKSGPHNIKSRPHHRQVATGGSQTRGTSLKQKQTKF